MPETTEKIIQKLAPGSLVTMYTLNAEKHGGPFFYFCNHVTERDTRVKWRGHSYEPLPITAEGFEFNGDGSQPRPRLLIGNVGGRVTAEANKYKKFIGCRVTRWRTYRQFLDDGDTPNENIHLPIDQFYVNNMTGENMLTCEFELASILDLEGVMLPKRVMTKHVCTHTYRVYVTPDMANGEDLIAGRFSYKNVTCPYAGNPNLASPGGGYDGPYFDENGNAVDRSADKCGKRVFHCRLRYGESGQLPFGGFPGMIRNPS